MMKKSKKNNDLLLIHLTQLFWDGLTLLGVRCMAFLEREQG